MAEQTTDPGDPQVGADDGVALPPEPTSSRSSMSWLPVAARAVVLLVGAISVTFTVGHSVAFGLVTLAAVAGALALVTAVTLRWITDDRVRRISALIAAAWAIVAIGSVIAALAAPESAPALIALGAGGMAASGIGDIVSAGVSPRGDVFRREWWFTGILAVIFAIVVAVIPADFHHQFLGPDQLQHELTTSILVIGLLSAAWAILGVYLAIAAVALRFPLNPSARKKDAE